MEGFVEALVGGIVWTFANVLFFDLKRKGVRGFGRFAAFMAGMPLTWATLFFVKDGAGNRVDPPPDDEELLLRDVRGDRELRGGSPWS